MDPLQFHAALEAIKTLNASEGPASNIFVPKFEARRQAEQLRDTVLNVYRDESSLLALQQLCHCFVFLGTTMMEVDEEEEGYLEVRRAYRILEWCTGLDAATELPASGAVRAVDAVPAEEILSTTPACTVTASSHYAGCVEYVAVHNALGLYLSKVDLSQAKIVLERAEALYKAWNAWWAMQPEHCDIADVPFGPNGSLRCAEIPPAKVLAVLQRFYMDGCYTSTLFFIAQLYTAQQNATVASQYCHRTMYYQLQNRQEFDPKSWASNALQLSGFYSSHFAYDKAYHCLLAGQTVMPPSEEPAESRGLVAWAFGRFYLHRLHHYSGLLTGSEPAEDAVSQLDASWLDFPGMPPIQSFPSIHTFEEARDCFKEAMKWLQEAQACRPFESACTEHIDIARDMVQLYAALQVFEPIRVRRIAMIQRQAHLLEPFPDQLNFNAYPVVVRQLLYDLGGIYEDQVRLRVQQRKQPQADEKPLKNKPFNVLVSTTLQYYRRFCETWRHPGTHVIPEILEEESRLPFFRALMRQAQVQLSVVHASPKEEYDGIAEACKAYTRAIGFYEKNPLPAEVDAQVAKEIGLAREMLKLLPVKQRDLWIAYQRTLS